MTATRAATWRRTIVNGWDLASLRFVLVGCSNAIIGYTVFWLGIHAPIDVPLKAALCQLASYAIGIGWSFWWNRRWTFRSTQAPALSQGIRFTILQVALALISSLLIGCAVDILRLSATPSWLAIMSVVTVINFVACRRWVFQ